MDAAIQCRPCPSYRHTVRMAVQLGYQPFEPLRFKRQVWIVSSHGSGGANGLLRGRSHLKTKGACHAALEVGLLRGRYFACYSPRAGDWLESSSAPSVRSVIQLPALLLSAGFARLLGCRRDPVYDRRSPPAIDPYPAQLSGPAWGLLRSVGGVLPWC